MTEHASDCATHNMPALPNGECDCGTQFLADVRAVVQDHWSGLPEHRPDELVWARLDAVLFDKDGNPRPAPDYSGRYDDGR